MSIRSSYIPVHVPSFSNFLRLLPLSLWLLFITLMSSPVHTNLEFHQFSSNIFQPSIGSAEMMGCENGEVVDSDSNPSREIMETVVLDEPSSSSFEDYKSSVSTISMNHPLSFPVDSDDVADHTSDPLLSPNSPLPINRTGSHSGKQLIDPPSYADVIFTPYSENGHESNAKPISPRSPSSSSSSPSPSAEYLKITVSDPQKEQEINTTTMVPGGSTYVTYLITTRTNSPLFGLGSSQFAVRRRFRDVVTLADRLAESYRGFFIPPRPDKSVVESQVMQKHEFLEQRRVQIEKYLNRLGDHPAIRKSDELKAFLVVSGRSPLPSTIDVASRVLDGAIKLPKQLLGDSPSVAGPEDVVQPAKAGRDLLRIFKELRQSVAIDWGTAKPSIMEEDKEFLEKKEKIQELEHQLSDVSQQAEALVKSQQDLGDTMGELGLAFVKLTKFENEEAVHNTQRLRAADTKRVATAAVKVSRYYRELNCQTVKHLDTLHEYLGLMMAVHNAFTDRCSALLTVQTLLSELSSLHSKAEKLEVASSKIFGGDRSRTRKVEELKETIKATEAAKFVALKEYERIKDNNRSELDRLDCERKVDFLRMLKGFVANQVGYAEKIASVWSKVADETIGYNKES